MHIFTRYLTVKSENGRLFNVSITDDSPIPLLQKALNDDLGLRYSPIFPAYLIPGQAPPLMPEKLTSLVFFFSRYPYKALGRMKPQLGPDELERVYFTQGLASILCVNCDLPRARILQEYINPKLLEYWPLRGTELDLANVIVEPERHGKTPANKMVLQVDIPKEVSIYVEQIFASIVILRRSYAIYNPEELKTLDRIVLLTERLIAQYSEVSARDTKNDKEPLAKARGCNAIAAALGEISASLSYAVTQGTSGCSPILTNPSPFPHFSLLGVGGAIRALTKFTRYLESAFSVRDASEVISRGYSCRNTAVPVRISKYNSGDNYKLYPPSKAPVEEEEFDRGGEFQQKNDVPLIIYFSLRHGFKESKFAITAASETLTSEVSPQWTLMTLSHEIMHNRVRQIFQALFGAKWGLDRDFVLSKEHYTEFKDCYESVGEHKTFNNDCAIRYAILNFCCAMDRAMDVRKKRRRISERTIPGLQSLAESYSRHKQRAMEIFVHFHDYYFSYAYQPMMYIMSLWASWIMVAAPYVRPMDYLIRTLATVACGTGLPSQGAFEYASEILDDALSGLERSGVRSPLYDTLRNLLKSEKAYEYFKPSYYLIDQVRRFFASREISSRIDRIEDDPFAEGSTSATDYSANIFVYGEEGDRSFISPIRFSIASLLRSMLGQSPIKDLQWLTAWNTIVISSQEVTYADT